MEFRLHQDLHGRAIRHPVVYGARAGAPDGADERLDLHLQPAIHEDHLQSAVPVQVL